MGITDRKQTMLDSKLDSEKEKKTLCLVKHNSAFTLFWEFLIAFVFVCTFFLTPLNMATGYKPHSQLRDLELLIDFIILIDICINFVSEKVKDVEVTPFLKEAALNYLRSYFIVDALSILPCLFTWEGNTSLYAFKLIRFCRIKRFF